MQCGLFLTAIWTLFVFENGVQLSKVLGVQQPGYLDFDNLPETNFTCEGKVIGGYYADIETGCQMFHVCTIGQKGDMTDIKFLCLNGTVFDQETRVCERVDEVDCSKSKDFYDLNLELYNSGFVLSEEETNAEDSGSDEESDSEEVYDESYDAETDDPPEVTTRATATTTATTTTTTTTTTTKGARPFTATGTTTPPPPPPPHPTTSSATTTSKSNVFTTVKQPTYSLLVPGSKNKNSQAIAVAVHPSAVPIEPVRGGAPVHASYPDLAANKPPHSFENKNVGGAHLAGLVPSKNAQTPRPYGYVATQSYDRGHFNKMQPPPDTGLKPPPTGYKPPPYDAFKNHYFPSSTQSPITSILVDNYNRKHQGIEEIHPSEESKRPVVVVSHHFPTITPGKNGYDEYPGFAALGLSAPGGQYVRHNRPPQQGRPSGKVPQQQQQQHHHHQQQQQQLLSHSQPQPQPQHHHHHHHHHHHPHKPNPTILALQSQQKKVHQLHQEGLEIAEHQIAQIANRNAEISNLRSQKMDDGKDSFEMRPAHRETKEIRADARPRYAEPAIAVVTSTSSTSSRVENKPVVTTYVKTVTSSGRNVAYKQQPEYNEQLEKLYATAEQEKKDAAREGVDGDEDEDEVGGSEDSSDMDLEQLLLAWKLKTNQEVTKEDIERVFSSLDTSKFKNGETISLSDIFGIMKNSSAAEDATRSPPVSYDDYTEEDVPYDPFYKDVPKVHDGPRRLGRSASASDDDDDDDDEGVGRGRRRDAKVAAPVFPETGFTCDGKIPGGLYADVEADCRFFHVCSREDATGSVADRKFYCGEGTKFDQKSRTCEAEHRVNCPASANYYALDDNLRIAAAEESDPPDYVFESKKLDS